MDLPFFNTIRNVRRTGEIIAVLVRYGFGDFVQETRLDRLAQKGRSMVGMAQADEEIVRLPRRVRIRKAIEELGATFIKVGQILSTRPDLVPPEWAEEFRHLQDRCPEAPFPEIEKRLKAEFHGDYHHIFARVEEKPIAAGSVAQAHDAELADGERVVVKVLRPHVREQVRADMHVLGMFAKFLEDYFENLGYSPTEVVDEFSRELRRELDFEREGRSTDRLRSLFDDDPNIRFPKVYWGATTTGVLTLERMEGRLLAHIEPEELGQQRWKELVGFGATAVFRQCFEFGFFHADPHPGNIILTPEQQLCFIDCGMTGQLDKSTSDQLARLVYGVVTRDTEQVIDAFTSIADVDPEVAVSRAFAIDVAEFLSHFDDVTLGQIHAGRILDDFFTKLKRHKIRCPADIVFLIKAITTIEGVARQFAPDFEIVAYARPHMTRLIRERYSLRAMRKRARRAFVGYVDVIERTPREIKQLVAMAHKKRITVNLEHTGLDRLTDMIGFASWKVANALIVSSLIVGSAILTLAASMGRGAPWLMTLAIIGLAVGATMTFREFVASWWRSWRRK